MSFKDVHCKWFVTVYIGAIRQYLPLLYLPGPLFTKWTDVLLQGLPKSQNDEIRNKTFAIALKFDRHLSSTVDEMFIQFQSDMVIIISLNPMTWRLHKIWL